jgi:hypothetical protein
MTITGFHSRAQRGSGERREHWPARAVFAALTVVLAVACAGGGGIRHGDALQVGFPGGMGLKVFPVGEKLGYLDEILDNRSSSPITLSSVTFPGAGKLLRTLEVKIGPVAAGTPGVGGGRYETDPPVAKGSHGCIVETLKPVKGYRLGPHALARIWVVFQAVHTGRYKITRHIVTYTQDGVLYQQSLPQGYEGVVTKNGTHLTPSSYEKPCLSLTTPLER